MASMYTASCPHTACCGFSAAATSSAWIRNRMDTIAAVVSIFAICAAVVLRVWH